MPDQETQKPKGFEQRKTLKDRDSGEEFTTIQKFSRALQGVGAGLQGKEAPFFQQDIERDRLKFQREQFALQTQVAQMQMKKIQHETTIDGLKLMGEVGKLASLETDPAKRQTIYKAYTPIISDMMARAGQNWGPMNLSSAEGVGSLMEIIATSGLDPETMLAAYPMMMNPNERKAYAALLKQDLGKAEEFAKSRSEARLNEVNTKFAGAMRQLTPEQKQQLGITDIHGAIDWFGQTLPPAQRAAHKIALQRTDPKVLDQLAAQIGVIGPGQVQKAGDIKVKAAAELQTPQGQAALEKIAAEIADLQTPKVIPQAAPETGLFVMPKGKSAKPEEFKAAVPKQKAVSPEAAKLVSGLEEQVRALGQVNQALKSGTAEKFVGPLLTGARFTEWAVKNLPKEWVGLVPDELALLDMAEFTIKNIHIQSRTGAAMSETETPRLMAEVPDRSRDKIESYRIKLRQAEVNATRLLARLRVLFSPEGSKFLIDPSLGPQPGNVKPEFYMQYPLPAMPSRAGRGAPISAEPE